MRIGVTVDVSGAIERLTDLERRQVPFAIVKALTNTAQAAQREVEREIPSVFDRPTPFTLRSVYVRPATKSRLYAEVKLKDTAAKGNPAVRWMAPQVHGGARPLKAFEKLLQRAGVMPGGWYAVPTRNAPTDQYGNVRGSMIMQILSQLHASRDPTANESATVRAKRNDGRSRAKKRLSRYFSVQPGRERTRHLAPGIWERVQFGFGQSVRPVVLFVSRAPRYKVRLKFDRIVVRTVDAQIGFQFRRSLQFALATAK